MDLPRCRFPCSPFWVGSAGCIAAPEGAVAGALHRLGDVGINRQGILRSLPPKLSQTPLWMAARVLLRTEGRYLGTVKSHHFITL
jgi:hypothetical protein